MRNEAGYSGATLWWRVMDDTSYRLLPVASVTPALFGTVHTWHMKIDYLWSLVCCTTASTWLFAQGPLGQADPHIPCQPGPLEHIRQPLLRGPDSSAHIKYLQTGQHDKFPRNHRSGSDQYCFSLPVGLLILQKRSALKKKLSSPYNRPRRPRGGVEI